MANVDSKKTAEEKQIAELKKIAGDAGIVFIKCDNEVEALRGMADYLKEIQREAELCFMMLDESGAFGYERIQEAIGIYIFDDSKTYLSNEKLYTNRMVHGVAQVLMDLEVPSMSQLNDDPVYRILSKKCRDALVTILKGDE